MSHDSIKQGVLYQFEQLKDARTKLHRRTDEPQGNEAERARLETNLANGRRAFKTLVAGAHAEGVDGLAWLGENFPADTIADVLGDGEPA